MKTNIRIMLRQDIPDVLEIANEVFTETWTEKDFRSYFGQTNHVALVAETLECHNGIHTRKVVGYLIYMLTRTRFHVVNLGVHPAYQRKGVGSEMMKWLKEELLNPGKRKTISLEVAETNLDAQLFYKACGLKGMWVERGYYQSGEDAYRMEYTVSTTTQVPV